MKLLNSINNKVRASTPFIRSHPFAVKGFSLIDILIGLLIGAFAIIVMLQVFAVSEGQKRTTTSTSDAQTNGIVALFELERDISQSGYGISTFNLIGCNVSGVALPSGVTLPMAPVTINPNSAFIPAGDANTDTLLVVYGNSASSPEGDGITGQTGNTGYTVQTPTSFVVGENVIAEPLVNSTPCSLILDQITTINTANQNVTVQTGATGMTNGKLFNLGPAPTIRAYAVRSGNLTVCDYTATNDCRNLANWLPFVSNIVSFRAEYGLDTNVPMDAIADNYSQALPSPSPSVACSYRRISALRFVVITRSNQYEKTAVTTAAPTWIGNAAINLTANPNWQNYRYTLLQTVAPIRNISWLGVQSGC